MKLDADYLNAWEKMERWPNTCIAGKERDQIAFNICASIRSRGTLCSI